ncbi:efflux RND transporter permease subunit [Dokdonella sp.]|uniref:efflux RND transporter permease subunit n=1 Tax=Dokdonella sp. TaxID=2291710 RepID=UPI003C5D0B83
MILGLIHWSIANRFLVLVGAIVLAVAGTIAVQRTPLDALPDLSDTQVILRTSWPGQSPQIVEDQVTYPLATTMMSVPDATTVRGFSYFGDSYVYVLFEDGTDPYWARSRVLEYLSQVRDRLPEGVSPALGPDATGVGWIYEYALVDRSGRHDLGELRALQDWFLRYQLKTVPDVAEVASIGGMVSAWQVVLDPQALAARGLTVAAVESAIRAANGASGGSVIEQGEAELMVRSVGYLNSAEDFEGVPLTTSGVGVPVLLGDVARVHRGPTLRRGIAELDGEGEVAGGIVVLRSGKNALTAIAAVKSRLDELKASLPEGVEVVTTYDRSQLIIEAVDNLTWKLIEEFLVVALVCVLFLWHLRSSLVAVITLPLGILAAFIVMRYQGISANLMSLGGIAIAIGAMVDASVVMIENMHKHLERWNEANPGRSIEGEERWALVAKAVGEVGPALFLCLLVITLSFLPVFALGAQEGRLFKPLAFTKTWAMAASAGLSVTLIPVLIGYLVRGRIRSEHENPLNRFTAWLYRPLLQWVLRAPRSVILVAGIVLLSAILPWNRLGSEFMPMMDEGSLLYMPSALPGISAGKASQLLQQTDRMLKTVPEVEHVFGKVGRADTATDPAPLTMFETTITFKPRDQWREGMTMDTLKAELDAAVRVPGLTNLFVYPIRNRIDMLSTGIKSPIGIKVLGPDTRVLEELAERVESIVRGVEGVTSAVAERAAGGRYVDVTIRREEAARYGLTQARLQSLIATIVGGAPIGQTIDGLERYPIVLRYPRTQRDSLSALRALPIVADNGSQLTLGQVAVVTLAAGPPMLKSENGQLATYIYVDTSSRDLPGVVESLQSAIRTGMDLPNGYTLDWSGQYEYLQHAVERLRLVIPATLVIVFLLIHLIFRRVGDAAIIMLSLPLALVGGIWLVWLLGHSMSVASMIGFIALAGVAAEFGVIMMLSLRQAWLHQCELDPAAGEQALDVAIREASLLRVRPKVMTVAVILAGLMPILLGSGAGSEVMQRIAAPMVGGMLTAPILSMLVIPAAFRLSRRRELGRQRLATEGDRRRGL